MTNSDNHCQVDKGEKIHMDNENPYVNRNEHSVNDLMHMVVNSEEEAYNLYNEYAARIGFSIRRGNTRYHVGTRNISQKEYYCSCQGFSLEPNCPTRYRNRFETRTGCEAMVRFSVKDGIWKVTKFLKSHNHELASQKEIHLLRSNRILTTPKANVIDSMVNASISTKNDYVCLSREVGGRDHIGFTKRDCYNCLNNEKMILIEAGDCQGVVNHFKVRQNQDGMFFYTIQVDQENRMTNFFWRDGRSRIDYDFFGDVVVFDTTYRTNKYDLICAPFVGVNHHWQNIMFGCAFLLDETTSSFVWLFKSFLESMGGKEPKTIITDENQEMANAIREVFPNSRHLLCQWHIAKNAPSHLGKFNSDPKFCKIFYKCLQECETEVEFQETWNKMMDEFSELRNHKWLNKLYEIRKSWCLAFNKDVFCGGIRSSQRSESRSHILNGIASKTTSLSQFVLSFEDLVEGWRYDERAEDFNCQKGMPPRAIQNSGLLHHAAQIFTAKIFFLFQKELLDGIATNWSEISCCDGVHSFKVMEENENSRISIVHFDVLNMDISCTCKKFECMGLLCSHALKIFVIKNVTRIPEKYILSRWTKNAKKIIIENEEEILHHENFGDAETVFRNNVMRYAYDIFVRSQGKESTRNICREALRKLDGDISKELGLLHLHENEEMKENDVNEKEPEDANPIVNPPKAKPKGVSNARLKGHFDERGKKKIKSGSTSEEVNCTSHVEAAHVGEKSQQLFSPSSTPMVPDHVVQHHLKPSDSMSMQIQMPNQLVTSCPSRTNAFSSEVPMSTATHPLSMPFQESSANISKRF